MRSRSPVWRVRAQRGPKVHPDCSGAPCRYRGGPPISSLRHRSSCHPAGQLLVARQWRCDARPAARARGRSRTHRHAGSASRCSTCAGYRPPNPDHSTASHLRGLASRGSPGRGGTATRRRACRQTPCCPPRTGRPRHTCRHSYDSSARPPRHAPPSGGRRRQHS